MRVGWQRQDYHLHIDATIFLITRIFFLFCKFKCDFLKGFAPLCIHFVCIRGRKVQHRKKRKSVEQGSCHRTLDPSSVALPTELSKRWLDPAQKFCLWKWYTIVEIFPPSCFRFPHGGKSEIFCLPYVLDLIHLLKQKFCPSRTFRVKPIYESVN